MKVPLEPRMSVQRDAVLDLLKQVFKIQKGFRSGIGGFYWGCNFFSNVHKFLLDPFTDGALALDSTALTKQVNEVSDNQPLTEQGPFPTMNLSISDYFSSTSSFLEMFSPTNPKQNSINLYFSWHLIMKIILNKFTTLLFIIDEFQKVVKNYVLLLTSFAVFLN